MTQEIKTPESGIHKCHIILPEKLYADLKHLVEENPLLGEINSTVRKFLAIKLNLDEIRLEELARQQKPSQIIINGAPMPDPDLLLVNYQSSLQQRLTLLLPADMFQQTKEMAGTMCCSVSDYLRKTIALGLETFGQNQNLTGLPVTINDQNLLFIG